MNQYTNGYTEQETALVHGLYPTLGANALSCLTGRTPRSIKSKADALGVRYEGPRLGGNTKHSLDFAKVIARSAGSIGRKLTAAQYGLTIAQVDWMIKRTR